MAFGAAIDHQGRGHSGDAKRNGANRVYRGHGELADLELLLQRHKETAGDGVGGSSEEEQARVANEPSPNELRLLE